MSDTTKAPKIERTPEQKAEELRIREMHRQNPVRVVPADTISNADARLMLKLIGAIKREREALGLTVEELAKRAAVDVDVLTRFEAAHSFNPTVSVLFRIARALGKDLVLSLNGISSK
jgi:ribosome-binding protein aMBF1 (putative translation factor)